MDLITETLLDSIPLKGVGSEHLRDKLILPAHLSPSSFGTSGQLSTIDPDDAASAGTTGLVADAGHQHQFTSAAAASLARTLTNTEGSASTHARSDHGHDTGLMAWGLLAAPTVLTANSADTSGTTELDLALDQTITITAGRRVELSFSFKALVGNVAADLFDVIFKEAGTQKAAFRGQVHETTGTIDGKTLTHTYAPTSGSRTFEVFLVRTSGTGVVHVLASSTEPATFTVKDVA